MAAVAIRGTSYPVLLPTVRDPRLHLAATITSLQVLGQVAFHFRLSIAQILISLGTCAVIEVAIALWKQHLIMWPASALLTGNGVAFVLRVPGTQHGDWWSLRGWWIFVATAGGALLSKHVIKWRGEHIFNPSNIGLVVVFLALGRTRVEPLDFWWGPMSWWMALALVIIVTGGFTILARLKLLRVALSFWAAFAVGIGGLALAGHVMTARWHLGPITGFSFWWVLVTSPEVLVFLFFMITDPKTAPRGLRERVGYAIVLGGLASILIAPTRTEFAAKVALLSALAIVCLGKAALETFPVRVDRRRLVVAAAAGVAVYASVAVFATTPGASGAAQALPAGKLPPITILASPGVQTQLDRKTAEQIAYGLTAVRPYAIGDSLRIHLEPGTDQAPPTAVAQLGHSTYRLSVNADGVWSVATGARPQQLAAAPKSAALAANRLTDVASSVGLDFRQGSFRFGMSNETKAMMGGGLCWLDYNHDGWLDLFVVNSYASADTAQWQSHGGLPRAALFENVHGTFRNVGAKAHADLAVQGDGCVAADLNGDGRPDLVVTTTSGVDLLWNDGNGTFTEGARVAGLDASGWYTGAAVADVNGDGRPDIFVAGYSDPNQPVPNSVAGFPTNLAGVRDLLYLNEGDGANGRARFREVGVQAGLESAQFRHGLGATFVDVNGDGRPDLYVADDEDPNQLYENVPWPGGAKADPAGLGFRFEERGAAEGVADPFAGMGVAVAGGAPGSLGLFVSNSRGEPSAAFGKRSGAGSPAFVNARPAYDAALGSGFAGWGASFVDLANSGSPDLVLAAGAIPVTSLTADAEPVRVLGPAAGGRFGDASAVLGTPGVQLNGRGLAAADVGNDGRMDVAVNTIGGKLVLLRPTGPSGHWLDVALSRFVPGAVVGVELPGGRELTQTMRAGGSYLSSEDPRAHFGLGSATTVQRVTVRYPWGASSSLAGVRADRIVDVAVPAQPAVRELAASSYRLAACTPTSLGGRSVARVWDDAAVAALRAGGAAEPMQARDLFAASAAMWDAWAAYDGSARGYFVKEKAQATDVQAARDVAISYAAYRLLLWRASYESNLSRTFALLTAQLRALCYSPDFTTVSGSSPAALGNRIAAAAIAAGRRDGSGEAIHYADPSFTAANAPLVVSQAVSTVHDPTFWQPLALAQIAPNGLAGVPAKVQSFVGAGWGRVRGLGRPARLDPGRPPFGDPSGATYKQAAVAVIRATSKPGASPPDSSPLAWNADLAVLSGTAPTAAARLRSDVRIDFALNGALEDAAIAVWRAKRAYQAPRPISMIRYLAFQGQSSDPHAPSFSKDGLPLVPGLVELITKASSAAGQRHAGLAADAGRVAVLSQGRWILGASWTPPVQTPASPGWVSEGSAFASAARAAVPALAERAARLAGAGLAGGIETPADDAAGRALGVRAGRMARAQAQRYFSTS
ncbi:MAG TPA: FG-GAP-like repeat-containing protein [Gaiellaceae bacterium]|nr:FG-GAP-like repeat-containing protein [Gaiellaceae bacterium]